MSKTLVFCLLTTLLFSVSIAYKIDAQLSSESDRIVGGLEAEPNQFPYQAALRVDTPPRHTCGGSIISERWVITAAHCIPRNTSTLLVVVGAHHISNDGVIHRLEKIIVHENYLPNSTIGEVNDIALLQTATEIDFGDGVRPIALNRRYIDGGVRAVVSGWGRLNKGGQFPDYLQFLQVYTMENDECRNRQHEGLNQWVLNATICTFRKLGHGACNGDSGGPLASGGKLIGLVSWGYPCARGFPDAFTRVSSYIDWISSHTGIIPV